MKKMTLVVAAALTIFSGAALAERGSAEYNKVIEAQSTSKFDATDAYFDGPYHIREQNKASR